MTWQTARGKWPAGSSVEHWKRRKLHNIMAVRVHSTYTYREKLFVHVLMGIAGRQDDRGGVMKRNIAWWLPSPGCVHALPVAVVEAVAANHCVFLLLIFYIDFISISSELCSGIKYGLNTTKSRRLLPKLKTYDIIFFNDNNNIYHIIIAYQTWNAMPMYIFLRQKR